MNLRTAPDSLRAVRLFLLAAGVAGLVIGFGIHASAGAPEGQMSVDCEGASGQVVAVCQYGEQQPFTLAIHAVSAPDDGYPAFQAKLSWDPAVLDYLPTAEPADETVWPVCTVSLRFDNRPADTSVLWGCATYPIERSQYTGVLVRIDFACIAPGTSQVTLAPRVGDPQGGSYFIVLDETDTQILTDPTLTGATVTCGGADVATPTPESTATATPSSGTPMPTATATPSSGTPVSTATPTPSSGTPMPTATATPSSGTPMPTATLGSPATWTPVPTWTPAPTWTPVSPAPDSPTSTPAEPTGGFTLVGDTNCDGAVDPVDATFILQLWAALIDALPCPDAADADGDGQDSLLDAIVILQFAAGFLDSLPP